MSYTLIITNLAGAELTRHDRLPDIGHSLDIGGGILVRVHNVVHYKRLALGRLITPEKITLEDLPASKSVEETYSEMVQSYSDMVRGALTNSACPEARQ